MGNKGFRKPYDLKQHDNYSCVSCVMANVLYMTRKVKRLPEVPWVDTQIGRQAGKLSGGFVEDLFLLSQGYELVRISALDEQRYLKEGLTYLAKFYGAAYTASVTAESVSADQKAIKRIASYSSQTTWCARPTVERISWLLARQYLVYCPLLVHSGYEHAMLIYAQDDTCFEVYYPAEHDTLLTFDKQGLSKRLRFDSNILGIKPRS